jgi:type II secretory pathway pseudopilin PulG
MKARKREKQKGFALIEPTVVVIVVAHVAVVAIPGFMRASTKTWRSVVQLGLKQVCTMPKVYRQRNNAYFPGDGGIVVVQARTLSCVTDDSRE